MTANLGTAAYKLVLDARDFRSNAIQSGRAMKEVQQVMRQTETPAEKLAKSYDAVTEAFEKGQIPVQTYERYLKSLNDTVAKEGVEAMERYHKSLQDTGESMKKVGTMIAGFGAATTAMFGVPTFLAISEAASFEQTQIAFQTMLGSADAAMDTLDRLTEFAAATPFQMPEIETVARGLIMFGESGDEMMETLKILGDAASGTGASFAEIGQIFNKVRGQNKLMTGEFNQLAERGIISMQDLATHFGVEMTDISRMLERGEVSFDDLRIVMQGLTSEGGRFADMMEKQSQSLTGLQSTLRDNVGIFLREIGLQLLPMTKDMVEFGIASTKSFGDLSDGAKQSIGVVALAGTGIGVLATVTGGSVIVAGQAVIAWGALDKALISVGLSAKGAAASMSLVVAGAAAFAGGYMMGRWLYDLTEEGQRATRVMNDLRDSLESIRNVDLGGADRGGLLGYIAAMERQISLAEQHNAELRQGESHWNDFQRAMANTEGIDMNNRRLEIMRDNLNNARIALSRLGGQFDYFNADDVEYFLPAPTPEWVQRWNDAEDALIGTADAFKDLLRDKQELIDSDKAFEKMLERENEKMAKANEEYDKFMEAAAEKEKARQQKARERLLQSGEVEAMVAGSQEAIRERRRLDIQAGQVAAMDRRNAEATGQVQQQQGMTPKQVEEMLNHLQRTADNTDAFFERTPAVTIAEPI